MVGRSPNRRGEGAERGPCGGTGMTSHRAIAGSLNANEIETPRGGNWGPSSVRNLLGRLEKAGR